MRRARDARVVVPDQLFAAVRELVFGELDVVAHELAEVALDRELVLRRRRDDLRVEDDALVVELVPVIEQAPRRLGRGAADAGARRDLDAWAIGARVRVDDPEGFGRTEWLS